MMNRFSAAKTAAKITGVDYKVILSNWRKGAAPKGKELNAVIVASQLLKGTFHKTAPAVEAEAKTVEA